MVDHSCRLALLVTWICLHCAIGSATEPIDAAVNYSRTIRPILKARCYACHGALKQEAGLRLDSGELIRKGSENGLIVSAVSTSGTLIERISSKDDSKRMPPEGEPLSAAQIAEIT